MVEGRSKKFSYEGGKVMCDFLLFVLFVVLTQVLRKI